MYIRQTHCNDYNADFIWTEHRLRNCDYCYTQDQSSTRQIHGRKFTESYQIEKAPEKPF